MILKIFLIQSCIFLYLAECQNEKDQPALFYRKTTVKRNKDSKKEGNDSKVEDILNWLQTRYKEVNKNRKTREEDPSRAYLPSFSSTTTQAPRPFQTQQNQYSSQSPQTPQSQFVQNQYSSQSPQSQLVQNEYSSQSPQSPQTQFVQKQYSSPSPQTQFVQNEYSSQSPQSPQTQYVQSQYPSQSPQLDQNAFSNQSPDTQYGQKYTTESPESPENTSEHPPHIHDIQVVCSKDKMDVNIEFSSVFNGVIYSKGYHNDNDCMHVKANSNQSKYTFVLYLNTCGTQFIEGLSQGISSYLENTLVIQNEQGILEVWDVVRNVRCLWEGSLDQNVKTGLSIGQLNQELVTFSGDTGTARLEIQAGRGPYSSQNTDLVMIGDLMTLVVKVEGDQGFDLRIGQCIGTDNTNVIQLTDSNGCPLKTKLMGGFQYGRHQQTNEAIAYAYFRAFKFPDVMDLTLECNVQLCKTDCRTPCSDPNQKYEPSRRRRSINDTSSNDDASNDAATRLAKTIRVIFPQELPSSSRDGERRVCLSTSAFYGSTFALAGLGLMSGLIAIFYWAKTQKMRK